MIRLIGISEQPAVIEAEYTPEVENYDITSEYLTDPFHGRRYGLGNQAMLWIDREERFAEIESIYPTATELTLCRYAPTLTTWTGLPRLEVLSKELEVYAQLHLPGLPSGWTETR